MSWLTELMFQVGGYRGSTATEATVIQVWHKFDYCFSALDVMQMAHFHQAFMEDTNLKIWRSAIQHSIGNRFASVIKNSFPEEKHMDCNQKINFFTDYAHHLIAQNRFKVIEEDWKQSKEPGWLLDPHAQKDGLQVYSEKEASAIILAHKSKVHQTSGSNIIYIYIYIYRGISTLTCCQPG